MRKWRKKNSEKKRKEKVQNNIAIYKKMQKIWWK